MSEGLFHRLQAALKAHGLTYAEVADRLGVSEVTIKRVFADKDCKLSRLAEICRVTGIDLHQLIDAEGQALPVPTPLSTRQSRALANNRTLLFLFLLLLNRYTPRQLMEIYALSEARLYLYLRELETLALIQLGPEMEAALCVAEPVDFSADQALAREIRQINQAFLGHTFDRKHQREHSFESLSRHLSAESAAIIRQDLADLATKLSRLAQRDALLTRKDALGGYKLTAGFGPVPFHELFSIE